MNIENAKTNMEFALAYAKKGWHVFPAHNIRDGKCSCGNAECKHPGKHPRTENGLNDAVIDEAQITYWWTQVPDANVAVRTGKISGIVVLDIDRDKGGFYALEEFDVPATLYSQTGGGGQHKIYKYGEKIPTIAGFRSGIDFRADGAYFIAPPSNHISGNKYVWCDESLEPALAPDWMKIKGKDKTAAPISEVIPEGQRNATLASLAGAMRRRGASPEAIEKALLEENKRCSPPLSEEEILTIAKSISRYEPYQEVKEATNPRLLSGNQLEQIKKDIQAIPKDSDPLILPTLLDPILKEMAGLNPAQTDAIFKNIIKDHFGFTNDEVKNYEKVLKTYHQEDEEKTDDLNKPVFTANYPGLVDIVEHDGSPAFLLKKGENLEIVMEIHEAGILYLPPPRKQIPWLLPRGLEVIKFYELAKTSPLEADQTLYDDLVYYHKEISELPSKEHYDLLTAWDMQTYLLESFQYFPILCLFAVPERGKTRTGKGLIYVAYRGIHVESLRDAYLVRVAQDLNATLFFDVKDIWKKAEKNGSEDILLHRFEKGATVARVLYPEKGAHQDIVYYLIFGSTIISTNEIVHYILDTRAITINMPETSRQFENVVIPEEALPLKERLLAFRARHMGEIFPNIPKPATGRLGDILKPILQIICLVKPERAAEFLKLIGEIETSRLTEKATSLEAGLLRVIISLEHSVARNLLPVKDITDEFNAGKPEKYQITYQKVGRRLSAMGFGKSTLGDGASAIVWDKAAIKRMQERYGLKKTSVTSETPIPSEADNTFPQNTDVSEVSDLF